MNKLDVDPNLPFEAKLQAWYNHLDSFINAEDKDKSQKDYAAWAEDVNQNMLLPVESLFKAQFPSDSPVKVQLLDAKPKVKKDDHLKKLKALRYNIFTYQRKVYLESVGDLG
jgi:hypothetical protein